jgi:hypothetical protein
LKVLVRAMLDFGIQDFRFDVTDEYIQLSQCLSGAGIATAHPAFGNRVRQDSCAPIF